MFGARNIKTRKKLANFQSISIHAIGSDRRRETISVPLITKLDH